MIKALRSMGHRLVALSLFVSLTTVALLFTYSLRVSSPVSIRINKESDLAQISQELSSILVRLQSEDDSDIIRNSPYSAYERAMKAVQLLQLETENAYNDVSRRLWRHQETTFRKQSELLKSISPLSSTNHTQSPRGSEIVIVWGYTTAYSSSYPQELTEQLDINRAQYCAKHGYISMKVNLDDYISEDTADASRTWLKIFALKDAYKKYPRAQWYMWIDPDAIIMDENIDLASLVLHPTVLKSKIMYDMPVANKMKKYTGKFTLSKHEVDVEDIELIASQDAWFINSGILLVKNTKFMRKFIETSWLTEDNLSKSGSTVDQDCLNDLLFENDELFKRWGPVSQSVFNAYHNAYSFQPGQWKLGDFIAHFPGEAKKHTYPFTWKKYWNNRIPATLPASAS